ncbi:MAG: type II and III secretion system protein family protein, partial [Pseudolabrys sp.]
IINVGNQTKASSLPITSTAAETAAGVISGANPFGFLLGHIAANGASTDIMINALEQKGIARSLAQPNLVALSGDTASFLAGGEYPIPVSGQFGQVTVDYKKYGVGLAFTPTVLDHGLINLKIEPEVSQIDTTHTVAVTTGVSVPALTVRRASTTIELRDGQSFMIGGLLQTDNKNQIDQLPWLGSVPVLGALFSSKSYQQNQTDLAIIVTPHLVQPMRPGDVVKTPFDDSLALSDVDFFLLGKTDVTRAQAAALSPATARVAAAGGRPFTGHMLDLPKGVSDAAVQ